MFEMSRMFTQDRQLLRDDDGKEWLVLYDLQSDLGDCYAMAVPSGACAPCPIQLVRLKLPGAKKEEPDAAV